MNNKDLIAEVKQRGHRLLMESLEYYANTQPDLRAYLFLEDGEREAASLTYREVYEQSRNIALNLAMKARKGDRALLLFPPGLEFVTAFFGCLMAGVIAVPLYVPTGKRRMGRLAHVASHADASVVLSTSEVSQRARKWSTDIDILNRLQWLDTDAMMASAPEVSLPVIHPYDVAFLQYTSGSTGSPKGVEVSQGNLMHNVGNIFEAIKGSRRIMSWLPIYHDMGLIGKIVLIPYSGGELVLMSPTAFIMKPVRMLEVISKYRIEANASPNFAYDLCTRDIRDEELEGLDLSSWVASCNGSEPILPTTVHNFHRRFAKAGLRSNVILPCYGMAETTLMVSGMCGEIHEAVLDGEALKRDEISLVDSEHPNALELAGSGPVGPGMTVRIADPESCVECPDNKIGEIWIQGESVAKGYWKDEQRTRDTFQAHLKNTDGSERKEDGPFLRSGDLGFVHEGILYITGRIKDLIIFNGKNYYPQDIEYAIECEVDQVQPHAAAAFAVSDEKGHEQLVIFQEVKRDALSDYDPQAVINGIREAVFVHQRLPVHAVYLISPGRIPKTTSGKIKRSACRKMFLTNNRKHVLAFQLEEEELQELA